MSFMVGALLIATSPENLLESENGPWIIVDDVVMGGRSAGDATVEEGTLVFSGELSLENNGGFSSVRHPVDEDLGEHTGILLEVRGDGRQYQFRLRHGNRYDGVAWKTEFPTSDAWTEVRLPFSEFQPTFRGRWVPDAGGVRPHEVGQIGFLLADKRPGPFRLEVRRIEPY
ncbi:MAG: CIA30 family protein [Xanthomonadales bacterium]|nr:CIA30 family protein [Xanthomonadales bacterium]